MEREILEYINQVKNFVLWHYQFGSKYDTPFWDYAKTLAFEDKVFDQFLDHAKSCDEHQSSQIFMVEELLIISMVNGPHLVSRIGMME